MPDFVVMGVDPGLKTGVGIVQFHSPKGCELLHSDELDFDRVMGYCQLWMPNVTRLVVERFIINQRTIKNSQAPYSLEVIGVVRAIALQNDLALEFQNAADGKSAVDNAMIRRLGLWHRGGKGHALDAIRHTVAYAIRKGWRDPRLVAPEA
jgi:hypothetical protein